MLKTAITAADLPSPATALPNEVNIIDVITFTAEMASKPQEIDPLLDPMRAITARLGQTKASTPADIATLKGVYEQLEAYLTTREPLRQFTTQTIRRAVYAHLEKNQSKPRATRPLIVIWLSTLGLAAFCSLLLPPVEEGRVVVGVAGIFIAIYTGAAWLFWLARKNFKQTLGPTYALLCTGIILIGSSFVQGLLILIFQLEKVPWIHFIYTYVPIITSSLVVYLGMVRFSHVLGMKLRLISPWCVTAMAITLGIGLILTPHVLEPGPEWMLDVSLLLLSGSFVYVGCAGIIILLALGKLAPYYKKPMAWLTATFALLTLSYGLILCYWFIPAIGKDTSIIPLLLGSFVALKAGTSFYRLKTE